MTELAVKKRSEYQTPAFSITETHLFFELQPEHTKVKARLLITRNRYGEPLILDGEDLELISVNLNGRKLSLGSDYQLNKQHLTIDVAEDEFQLEIENVISPKSNTSLEGLYFVKNTFCTQCEAEGFRKITYYLDRPDVLSTFWVTIKAHNAQFPFLLSNGNLISESIAGEYKIVEWHDPHPKPCYLFALVAGDFDLLEDVFVTSENRSVTLQLFVEKGRKQQGSFALESLKRAMKWDEERYGLAYDLDIYMVVAIDFFNMGAMENKGLNVFNSKFVLAEQDTATDEDYFNIEAIIAHEYFHNWTGNRVTCRDWFQLSLKEGLTVFRDQQFSADMASALSTRISQVKVMREHQFVEDAGPMSHPIRPDEVMEMNNFYTVTVYDKGAEVIRMMHTLLGEKGFTDGMQLYFARHDGQAVTCDDFVQAMQDASDVDLSHFRQWYSQSGTPVITINKETAGDYTAFDFTQTNPVTQDQSTKQPLYVPIKTEILSANGDSIDVNELQHGNLIVNSEACSLKVNEKQAVPVFLDQFSAPVIINYSHTNQELLTIISYSKSDYAKWDASQTMYSRWIKALYEKNAIEDVKTELAQFADLIPTLSVGLDVIAELLTIPSFATLSGQIEKVDPLKLNLARNTLYKKLANALSEYALQNLKNAKPFQYAYEQSQVHYRLAYSVWLKLASASNLHSESAKQILIERYESADNMTDKLNCLKVAQQTHLETFDMLMAMFEESYRHDSVVMDKWFSLHATTEREDILARIELLMAHSLFDVSNPNKVRSLIGSFGFYNAKGLHARDASGYKFLCDNILKIDSINPQVASRILTPMLSFNHYAQDFSENMQKHLGRIFNAKNISKDLFEKLSKALTN